MRSVTVDLLRQVIELQHGGQAAFIQTVRIAKWNGSPNSWDGAVHIFNLTGNAQAKRAFAWAAPIAGSSAPRFFAVLQSARVRTPADAVKAAAAAIQAQAAPVKTAPARPAFAVNPAVFAHETISV